jgi:urease subunit alpha
VANNARVLRYLAKLTVNPALAHGIAAHVGSIQPGRLADIVLWNPAWFGAQPELVIKSGFVAWGAAGSGSGSTRLTQPRRMRPFYGGHGDAPTRLAHVFVAGACLDDPAARAALPAGRTYSPIAGSRGLGCADMLHNTATPQVEVAPEPQPVRVDGREIPLHRASTLPLTRMHHLG